MGVGGSLSKHFALISYFRESSGRRQLPDQVDFGGSGGSNDGDSVRMEAHPGIVACGTWPEPTHRAGRMTPPVGVERTQPPW